MKGRVIIAQTVPPAHAGAWGRLTLAKGDHTNQSG